MLISIKDRRDAEELLQSINLDISLSRFTIGSIDILGPSRLKLREIRLKDKKLYCGNHPNACAVNLGGRSMGHRTYLEGADWVDFNDRINDLLDSLMVDANVKTSVCEIRRGKERRIYYGSHNRGFFWEWDMKGDAGDYEDYRGKLAPNSEYPEGTPGEYLR